MASLSTKPGSVSKAQITKLIIAAKAQGFDLDYLHDWHGDLHDLSAEEASKLIEKYSGDGLPHPPGQAPKGYRGKAKGTRIITQAHIDQIERLLVECFGEDPAMPPPPYPHGSAFAWLWKNVKELRDVPPPQLGPESLRKLATAQRAGEVIRVLKGMLARKAGKQAISTATGMERES